jgi:biopolymer transport protein ExbD
MSDNPTELDAMFREAPEAEEVEEVPVRRRGRMKGGEHGARELNLTAMMDMMTIILVFLLKNYSTTPENVSLSDTLAPPRSSAKIPMEAAVTITVTQKELMVEGKSVGQVDTANHGVAGEDPKTRGTSIAPLSEALDKKVADLKAIQDKGGPPFEGKLLVVADQKVTYELLMRVLYTAGVAQFSQYKLVVQAEAQNEVMKAHE